MNRMLPLAAALLLVPLAAPLFAQSPAATPARPKLDANADGVIDRAEAAQSPRLAEHFDALDANHDGRLSATERPHHGGKGGRHGGGFGLERFDADHDGRLSRAEFDAGMAQHDAMRGAHAAGAKAGARSSLPKPEFAAIDSNRDGYLVGSELRAHHEKMKPQMDALRARHMDEMFTAADINGDGKLGRVEVDEKLPRMKDRFAWLDENRDGFLSRAEMKAAHGRR